MSQMSIEVVAKSTNCASTEGPHWLEATQQLLYVDYGANQLHVLDCTTGQNSPIKLEKDDDVTFVIPKDNGDFIISTGQRLCSLEKESKRLSHIAEVETGTENYLNDAKCDAFGRLWTGTYHRSGSIKPENSMLKQGSMYSYDPKQGLRHHMSEITFSNGLGWSTSNETMFFVDSVPGTLYALDFNLHEGSIANKQVVLDFSTNPALGLPDGLCVDYNDNLWVAGFYSGKVHNIDPRTGQVLRSVKVPVSRVTSCCFGGSDYSELFVTSANAIPPEEGEPLAGSVFKITGLGVKGRPAFNYRD